MGSGGEAGTGDEHSGVGSSSLPHRTNLSAIHTRLPATITPDWLADDMVALADIRDGMTVLEPSAGTGQIVRAIHRRTSGKVTAVELNARAVSCLRDENCHRVIKGDFLKTGFGDPFDRVVMNPPMDAVAHVMRAASELERGGRLIALVHAIRAFQLRKELPGMRTYRLPNETFVEPDAGWEERYVHSTVIVWDRP